MTVERVSAGRSRDLDKQGRTQDEYRGHADVEMSDLPVRILAATPA